MLSFHLTKFKFIIALSILSCNLTNRSFAQEGIPVPGSKFSMIAPTGFTLANGFVGYQNSEKNASIMLVFIPGPFEKISGGLTSENLLKTGVKVSRIDSMRLDGYPARWIEGSQEAYGSKFLKRMLIFGDSSKTIMVNCAFPEEYKELEQIIVKSALSVRYNGQLIGDVKGNAAIIIDTRGTDFSLVSDENRILSFKSAGGQGQHPALFIVAPSMGKALISDQRDFSISRLKKIPGAENADIREISEVDIDGMKGYEMLAEKTVDGGKIIIYQMTLFNDKDEYYIMVGNASNNPEENLKAFKQLAKTFKRR